MNSGARAREYNRWHCNDRLQGRGVLIATRGSTPGRSEILKPLGAAELPVDEVVEHLHKVLVTEVVTELFLMTTTTTTAFFERPGFRAAPREMAPLPFQLQRTREFSMRCPSWELLVR